jgi:hypothetical protein
MGKKDPMYFQLASVIARAYQDVFDDDVLMIIIKNAQNKSGSKPAPPLDSESGNGKNL